MKNPWLDIPLADYEGHMALPNVGQAQLLSDVFAGALTKYAPRSVAVLGCAGGNGLDRVSSKVTERVVGVDLNPDYVQQARTLFDHQIPLLELLVGDVQTDELAFAPVELVYRPLNSFTDFSAIAMLSLMSNTSLAIKLQPAERTQLEKWESSHGTPQQVAMRCRIILGAVAGQQNVAIAEELGVSRPTVLLWRKRVREQGIGEVWEIAPGRGRKPHYDQAKRDGIINATLQSKPKGRTHWSCRLMAEAT